MILAVGIANAQGVTGITMVDVKNQPLLDLDDQPVADPINNNQTIFLNRLASTSFSFRANTAGTLSRLLFTLTNVSTHTQVGAHAATAAPYTVCDYQDCSVYFPAGPSSCGTTYLLQAVPYSTAGIAGTPYSVSFTMAPGGGLTMTQDAGGANVTVTLPIDGDSELKINDSQNFDPSAPVIVDLTSIDSSVQLNTLQSGLVPGTTYYFQSLPSGTLATCVIQPQKWNLVLPQPDYLRQAWLVEGVWFLSFAGMQFDPQQTAWSARQDWFYGPNRLSDPATEKYFTVGAQLEQTEQGLRQGVNEAEAHNDLRMMDELADYYTRFLTSTVNVTLPGDTQPSTLGARVMTLDQIDMLGQNPLLRLSTDRIDNSWLQTPWPGVTRTIVTVSGDDSQGYALTECALCNLIFLSPAAELVRLISAVPREDRKPHMEPFVNAYVPFLVGDQLLRSMYNTKVSIGDCAASQGGPFDIEGPISWYKGFTYRLAHGIPDSMPARDLECYAMFNNDLYATGMAADILGANANDPNLVQLDESEQQALQDATTAAVAYFQLKGHIHSGMDFANQSGTGVSYFDGDFAYLDRYACYSTAAFPTAMCDPPGIPPNPNPLISWDYSHYGIVPMFLRTLFDNKKILGGNPVTNFPQPTDLQLAANQLVYNVMHDDTDVSAQQRPIFSNYMDGTDGWYRVGYHGPDFGYPPSIYCNARLAAMDPPQGRPCVGPVPVGSWGGLANFNQDLNQIQQNVVSLAQSYDANQSFLDQYYFYVFPFSFWDSAGHVAYPPALQNILFSSASQVQ